MKTRLLYKVLLICFLFSFVKPLPTLAYDANNNWVDWEKSFDNHELFDVCYGNNVYVAVGADGIINISKDGKDWYIGDSKNSLLTSVVYGDKAFVAVGSLGKIYYSKDGISWTLVSSGTNKDLKSISWNGSMYSVVGDKGTILVSSDGLSWQNVSTKTEYSFNNVINGNGIFLATVSDSFNNVIISQNGLSWKEVTPNTNFYGYNNVTFNGNFFIMWAKETNNSSNVYLKSYDGINWSKASNFSNILSVTSKANQLVALGYSTGQSQDIYFSYDGTNWDKRSIRFNPNNFSELKYINYLGDKFIGIDYYSNIYTSIDGVTWIKENSNIDFNYENIEIYNNSLFIYDKIGNSFSSKDGIEWNKFNKYLNIEKPIRKLLFSQNKIVAIAGQDSNLYTSNGYTFIKQDISKVEYIDLLESNKENFIVAGNNIYRLNNFNTLEKLNITNEELNAKDFAFNGNLYVFVGGENIIYGGEGNYSKPSRVLSNSTDLKTWIVNKTEDSAINSVVWANNKFVAVGNDGAIIYSFDGHTWKSANSNTNSDLMQVIWDGSYFVSCGENGSILYSKDGVNWMGYRNITNDTLTKIVWTGENYLVLGTHSILSGYKSNAPVPYFIDTKGHWAEELIYHALDYNLIKGMDESHFSPNKSITRAEFAAIIVRALNLRSNKTSHTMFSDVKSSDWFYDEIMAAYENNILTGYGGGLIKPNDFITREEAMVIIERVMKQISTTDNSTNDTNNYLSNFKDYAKISNWASNAASKCIKYNVFNGSNGYLRPKDSITRAETAKIILMTILK